MSDLVGPVVDPGPPIAAPYAAVVLAGGAARRMGGVSKPNRTIGGRPLLLRVLDAAEQASPRIVVGPPDLAPLLPEHTSLTIEHGQQTGPVAGLAAGVAQLPPGVTRVAVLSCDLPFLTAAVLNGLSTLVDGDAEVAVLADEQRRPQWLAAMWRHDALVRRLSAVVQPAGAGVHGPRMRDLVAPVRVASLVLPVRSGPPPWFDCDTEDDIRAAEEMLDADSR
jgi:molybdopterin-guanine dinucleotide biosynthesis protein A